MSVTVKFKDGSIVEYPDADIVLGVSDGIEIARTGPNGQEVLGFVASGDAVDLLKDGESIKTAPLIPA